MSTVSFTVPEKRTRSTAPILVASAIGDTRGSDGALSETAWTRTVAAVRTAATATGVRRRSLT
jgi:hypothetical protein